MAKKNKGARRFQLTALEYDGDLLETTDGEVIVRADGTVGITVRGKSSMSFSCTKNWTLADDGQRLEKGVILKLVGKYCGVSPVNAEVTLGEENIQP